MLHVILSMVFCYNMLSGNMSSIFLQKQMKDYIRHFKIVSNTKAIDP